MGFLDTLLNRSEKSIDEYEEDLERVKIQTEIQGARTELTERQALEKELKSKYGPAWKKMLGLKGLISVPTLKSALREETGKAGNKIRSHGL